MTFALVTLILGEGDDALGIRREAWTRGDGEGWKLAPAVVEASEHAGPTVAELGAWCGPQGFVHLPPDVWAGADRDVEPAQSDGDEPEEWVNYASLARSTADWARWVQIGSDELSTSGYA